MARRAASPARITRTPAATASDVDTPPATLGVTSVGARVQVLGVDLPAGVRRRLAEFGVRPGAGLTVLTRTAGGGRVVAIGTGRLALDRATLAAVTVAPKPAGVPAADRPAT